MIVNLYVDHLMAHPPTSAEDIWTEAEAHPALMRAAAHRIGLTPAEYREFKKRLLDGQVVYVKLPRRMDAMSGRHGSYIYAVKNAQMRESVMGWQVALSDGTDVYVPEICGNLSMARHMHVAMAHVKPVGRPIVYGHVNHTAVAYVPAIATQPVEMAPPSAPAAPVTEAAPAEAPASVASSHGSPFYLLIPAAIFGALAGTSHGGSSVLTPPPVVVPPCSGGSNALFACQK